MRVRSQASRARRCGSSSRSSHSSVETVLADITLDLGENQIIECLAVFQAHADRGRVNGDERGRMDAIIGIAFAARDERRSQRGDLIEAIPTMRLLEDVGADDEAKARLRIARVKGFERMKRARHAAEFFFDEADLS